MFGCSSNKETFLQENLSVPGLNLDFFDATSEERRDVSTFATLHKFTLNAIKDQDRKLKRRLNAG